MIKNDLKNNLLFYVKNLLNLDKNKWSLCFLKANIEDFIYNKIKQKKLIFLNLPNMNSGQIHFYFHIRIKNIFFSKNF